MINHIMSPFRVCSCFSRSSTNTVIRLFWSILTHLNFMQISSSYNSLYFNKIVLYRWIRVNSCVELCCSQFVTLGNEVKSQNPFVTLTKKVHTCRNTTTQNTQCCGLTGEMNCSGLCYWQWAPIPFTIHVLWHWPS